MSLNSILEASGLFSDAALTDSSDNLLFLSVWGRDTAAHEFLARLSLPRAEGGLSSFRILDDTGAETLVQIRNQDRLTKSSGRTPNTLFGDLSHLWLYDPITRKPDKSNQQAMLLFLPSEDPWIVMDRVWSLIKETSHLPMLDHWRPVLLPLFLEKDWLTKIKGICINAWSLNLSHNDTDEAVTRLIQSGRLTLN